MANIESGSSRPAAAVALAAGLAACGGGSDGDSSNGGGSTGEPAQGRHALLPDIFASDRARRPAAHLRRSSTSRTSAGRVYRRLVAFPITTTPRVANTPVPDLATDTGTSSEGGKIWEFTLKDGVKWEDGKPITCEDFKYGASRVVRRPTSSPVARTTSSSYLDIPTDTKTGLPAYNGPYKGDGQDAVRQGRHLRRQHDHLQLQQAVAGLPARDCRAAMMDPYREDKDQGEKSNFQIFSNGPYKLEVQVGQEQGRDVRPQRRTTTPHRRPDDSARPAGQDRLQHRSDRPRRSTTG